MTTPLSGFRPRRAQISTDETVGNLKELKTNLTDTITYTPGGGTLRRGDGRARILRDEMLRVTFDPDIGADQSWSTVFLDYEGNRMINFEFPSSYDGTNLVGFSLKGIAIIDVDQMEYTTENGVWRGTVTLYRPRNVDPWVRASAIVAE